MEFVIAPPLRTWSQEKDANGRIWLGLWNACRNLDVVPRHQPLFYEKRNSTRVTSTSSQF
jgi:hypothetical protein